MKKIGNFLSFSATDAKKKRGYFYTLDAIIAVIILVIGIMIITGFYFYAPDKEKSDAITTDVTSILSDVYISDICEETGSTCTCHYYPSLENPDVCRFLDPNYNLMDVMGLLYFKNRRNDINNTLTEIFVASGIKPANYDMQILLTDGPDTHQLFPLIEQ